MTELTSSPKNPYRLAGLSIVSELLLPGLFVSDVATVGEVVTIRQAPIPVNLPPPVTAIDKAEYHGNSVLFTIADVSRYLIRDGNEILVDPEQSAAKNDIRAYLMGSVFGILCHQRGIVPLHSAAIDFRDGCVAFIGPSGAGKSTLAATLAARGHQVIADDVGFLRPGSHGATMLWPGISRIRLWEDAVAALGCNGPGVEREFRGHNKYVVPVRSPKDPFAPRRLRRVYQLEIAPAGAPTTLTQVRGAEALEVLMQNIYCAHYAECMGRKPAAFAMCVTIAREIPVFRFTRPLSFQNLNAGVEVLEDHLHSGLHP